MDVVLGGEVAAVRTLPMVEIGAHQWSLSSHKSSSPHIKLELENENLSIAGPIK